MKRLKLIGGELLAGIVAEDFPEILFGLFRVFGVATLDVSRRDVVGDRVAFVFVVHDGQRNRKEALAEVNVRGGFLVGLLAVSEVPQEIEALAERQGKGLKLHRD